MTKSNTPSRRNGATKEDVTKKAGRRIPCKSGNRRRQASTRKPVDGSDGHYPVPEVEHVPLSQIRPSPENDRLYRPVDLGDPEIVALANSIRKKGLLEPLVISADGFIVSGHRRFAAATLADLASVRCRRLAIRREDDPDGFLRLLREFNRQRDKTRAEKLREELVDINPDEAHEALHTYRRSKAVVHVKPLAIRGKRSR